MSVEEELNKIEFGQTIYDENGRYLGTVRGFDESGFYVSADEGIELPDDQSGGVHTDALMWRCWDCGEMGQLGEIPEECPDCGAPKEDIYYWQED
jgi:rubrerythrin